MSESHPLSVGKNHHVSTLLDRPEDAWVLLVLAHGAGAGMRHPSLSKLANALGSAGVATLRYHFPYMEQGGGRPDPPALLHATVRAAVAAGRDLAPDLPLFAGGRSMGGRMTSGAAAEEALSGVHGIAFFGFPLHPPGRPSTGRADHLERVMVPLLFLQGTRDDFANLDLLRPIIDQLGARATLHVVEGADHSFHVLKRSGRTDADVMQELVDAFAEWAGRVVNRGIRQQ